jgi:hypothetical protein
MILRRVIGHFRKQDWTAIALDFLIVVIGVFVGIQVSNWNENRGDRAAEIGYLAGLEKDVRFSIESLEAMVMRMEEQQAKRSALYHYSIDPGATIGNKDFATLLHGALFLGAPLRVDQTTFESLKNSGRLRLLKSDELTSSLQALSEKIAFELHTNAEEFQVMYLFSDPMLVEHFPLDEMFQRQRSAHEKMVPWLSDIRPPEDVPEFAKTVKFSNVILYRASFTQVRLRGSRELLELCRETLDLINQRQAELGMNK